MRPDHLWQREILEQTRRKRSCVVKFTLPLVLTAPLLLPNVPVTIRGDAFTLLLIFIGVFGSAIGLIRTRETGMMARMAVLPLSPVRLIAEYLLAHSLIEGLQFLVPLILITGSSGYSSTALIGLGMTFFIVILAANAIGVMVAVAAGSSGEGHLFAVLSVLGVIALSGLFCSMGDGLQTGTFLPFRYFRDILLTGSVPVPEIVLSSLTGLAVVAIALLISPRLFRMA
jgi:hypothetical protein